jgi:hypothetical protein
VQEFVGSWSWVESSGGIAGVTLTPASTGETMTVRFGPDGVAELARNGALVRSVTFTTGASRDASTWTVMYDEPLFGGFSSQAASLSGDTLTLVDDCCDGFVYRFERLR